MSIWRTNAVKELISALCLSASCLTGLALLMKPVTATAAPLMGVYRWDVPKGTTNITSFENWLGRPMDLAEAFEAADRWDNIAGPGWQLPPWSKSVNGKPNRNLILGVPLLPGGWNLAGPDGKTGTADDLSLAKCAAGQYDVHFKTLSNNLMANGLSKAYLRLGWEMDGGWYAWRTQQGQGRNLTSRVASAASFKRCAKRSRRTSSSSSTTRRPPGGPLIISRRLGPATLTSTSSRWISMINRGLRTLILTRRIAVPHLPFDSPAKSLEWGGQVFEHGP